jgi:hypothetical protein
MNSTAKRLTIVAVVTGVAFSGVAAFGTVAPGTPGKDVTIGLDNDNVTNTFIQPPGVTVPQDMNNTDVLFGRDNDDLLIGKLGSDTLVAGNDADILVGGPENRVAPSSDVLLGEEGPDVSIWAPGDGNDAFAGDTGYDTEILAPFVTRPNGELKLEFFHGRRVPRVVISDQPNFSCELVKVPRSEQLGAQFLVRFEVGGVPVATMRLKDVELVLCPSPYPHRLAAADLTRRHPSFSWVRLNAFGGVLGAIVKKP